MGNYDRALINEDIEVRKNDINVLENDDCTTRIKKPRKTINIKANLNG